MNENIKKALLLINPDIIAIQWDQSISNAEELANFKEKEWASLRRRYRELILNVHPDKNQHRSEIDRNATDEKAKEYIAAFAVLSDAQQNNELWNVIGTLDDFDGFSPISEASSENNFNFSPPLFSLDNSRFRELSEKACLLTESNFLVYLDGIDWKKNLYQIIDCDLYLNMRVIFDGCKKERVNFKIILQYLLEHIPYAELSAQSSSHNVMSVYSAIHEGLATNRPDGVLTGEQILSFLEKSDINKLIPNYTVLQRAYPRLLLGAIDPPYSSAKEAVADFYLRIRRVVNRFNIVSIVNSCADLSELNGLLSMKYLSAPQRDLIINLALSSPSLREPSGLLKIGTLCVLRIVQNSKLTVSQLETLLAWVNSTDSKQLTWDGNRELISYAYLESLKNLPINSKFRRDFFDLKSILVEVIGKYGEDRFNDLSKKQKETNARLDLVNCINSLSFVELDLMDRYWRVSLKDQMYSHQEYYTPDVIELINNKSLIQRKELQNDYPWEFEAEKNQNELIIFIREQFKRTNLGTEKRKEFAELLDEISDWRPGKPFIVPVDITKRIECTESKARVGDNPRSFFFSAIVRYGETMAKRNESNAEVSVKTYDNPDVTLMMEYAKRLRVVCEKTLTGWRIPLSLKPFDEIFNQDGSLIASASVKNERQLII